ncbi:MAG: asparagine--tRNA ligase [bacterium]|nr:MAG: asparagine--tRNA ligase [bacterium]
MRNEAYVEDIAKFEGQEITISGWLYNKRSSGKLHFLLVRDGTGTIQAVMSKAEVPDEVFKLCDTLPQESSIKVTGKVVEDKRSPIGYEIQVKDVELMHQAEEYPITPKEHGIEFLMDLRHLWLRSSKQHAILRVRHAVIRACRDFFDGNGFVLVDAPIFTPAACEGTSTLFETDYFGSKAYLTQSGQLYMEAAATAFGKVYCFGPTFRAEKSKTRRHLTEFWMIEPEVAYCDLDGDMDLAEEFVEYIVQIVLKKCEKELTVLERDTSRLENVKRPFPRISYDEAVKIIKEAGLEFEHGNDFGGTDETVVSDKFDRPVMVHRYPSAVKAFYMKNDPEDLSKALCVDVLAPEGYGEIIGGGQREDDLKVLEEKIRQHNLPMEAFDWYLDVRKYGSVPHSGFGLGIERTVSWICGLKHIRETIPFPRTIYRLKP